MSFERSSPASVPARPSATVLHFPSSRRTGAVQAWLWTVAAMIILMVVVGGATRLTESGLSITEWAPLFGAVPPLTAAAWEAKFEAYKQIPQYALHPDMTLGEFQRIFFWEWSHRLIGRLLGLVIAVPMAWFWWRGRLGKRLKAQSVALLVLVGLQGAVGWWMVKSGLVDRTEVSQYRLALHLLLATATLGFTVWLAQGLRRRPLEVLGAATGRLRGGATLLIGLVTLQIGLGALVAGLRAGYLDNTWPLMEGGLVPPMHSLLFLQPVWRNLFENATTVQFDHRLTAYVLFAAALAYALAARRIAPGTRAARRAVVLTGLVLCQAVIGIVTLLWVVPLGAALAHQVFAMAVFSMAVVHRRALSPPSDERASQSARPAGAQRPSRRA